TREFPEISCVVIHHFTFYAILSDIVGSHRQIPRTENTVKTFEVFCSCLSCENRISSLIDESIHLETVTLSGPANELPVTYCRSMRCRFRTKARFNQRNVKKIFWKTVVSQN